jgi:hypothetical protein
MLHVAPGTGGHCGDRQFIRRGIGLQKDMGSPVLTRPPVRMLAQLVFVVHSGAEPHTRLLSRDLGPWFLELSQAGQKLPVGTLIDGEVVIADKNGCVDFTALQVRLSSARTDPTHYL